MFYLTGARTGYKSFCRFQALAIPDLLEDCDCVVLLHHDKHDYCFGLYTKEILAMEALVTSIEERLDRIVVPFSIPPMLARWDRAIWELRRRWNEEKYGPFPIPTSARNSKLDETIDENSSEDSEEGFVSSQEVSDTSTNEDTSVESSDGETSSSEPVVD